MQTDRQQDDDVVRREIVLPGTPDRVWALVADPSELATWLADELWIDALVPGEEGLLREGDTIRRVVVDEVEPGRRLALRWSALPNGEERLVELTLHPEDEQRTRLVVVELPWASVRAVAPAIARSLPTGGPLMAV
jgi:uncharacterized protein YndB with AHSA1/START domain